MNPNDRNASSNDPNSRPDQDSQGTDPLRSAPGNQTWNQPSQNPTNRPAGQTDGADDDEDVDDGETETRQAGSMNPGSRRETPDDAMRRERGAPSPEKGDRSQQTQPERNPDDRTPGDSTDN